MNTKEGDACNDEIQPRLLDEYGLAINDGDLDQDLFSRQLSEWVTEVVPEDAEAQTWLADKLSADALELLEFGGFTVLPSQTNKVAAPVVLFDNGETLTLAGLNDGDGASTQFDKLLEKMPFEKLPLDKMPLDQLPDEGIGEIIDLAIGTALLEYTQDNKPWVDGGDISDIADPYDFTTLFSGSFVYSANFYMENTGDGPATSIEWTFTGDDAEMFGIRENEFEYTPPSELMAGDSAKFGLEYRPTTVGEHTATFEISYFDGQSIVTDDFSLMGTAS